MASHDGMPATSAASRPSGIDFSCGRHSLRPSGTRSTTRRVSGASRSSSARNSSVNFIANLLLDELVQGQFSSERLQQLGARSTGHTATVRVLCFRAGQLACALVRYVTSFDKLFNHLLV